MESLLRHSQTIAVVGLSDKPDRPSYQVALYLMNHGYQVIPVNPNCATILGQTCYAHLSDIPVAVDIVDVFRQAKDCLDIAKQAVAIGAKSLWLQLGIVNQQAAEYAKDHGLEVVMDRCIKIEHAKLN